MSWRAESTFKPSSKLSEEEKEYLKLAKKLREVLKLEERQTGGEALEGLQQEKVAGKNKLIKEVASWALKLPQGTEVFEKNPDITELLDPAVVQNITKKRVQEQRRVEKKQEQEVAKREAPEFMTRHDKPIVDVTLAADGRHLFTCSKDKYVLCWSLKNKLLQVVTTFAGHKGAVFALDAASGPCGLASGGADGEVHFWQADTSKLRPGEVASPMATCDHGGIVRVLRWCPSDLEGGAPGGGRRLASASEKLVSKPPAICIWRVGDRGRTELISRIDDPKVLPGKANDLRWGGGGKAKLFSCHDNGYVGVWSAEGDGALLKTLKLHSAPIISLALSHDGTTLVTASHDQTALAVDVSRPSTETVMQYKANRPLNAVCLTSDFKAGSGGAGAVIVAGGKNARDVTTQATLDDEFESKVLDGASGEEVASTSKAHFGPVHRFLALPQLGKSGAFASVSEDGCLKVHGLDGRVLHSDVME
mmetsp:Transcript_170171/g.545728  ORF Transcript_170171/g.545728 Transcript_170171/m.545728 type:complete len:477 (-) Transcript_170171:64-1494(-)